MIVTARNTSARIAQARLKRIGSERSRMDGRRGVIEFDGVAHSKNSALLEFSVPRALRAGGPKSAARRSVWQAGNHWVRFERFEVVRVPRAYPIGRTEIAADDARGSARVIVCE